MLHALRRRYVTDPLFTWARAQPALALGHRARSAGSRRRLVGGRALLGEPRLAEAPRLRAGPAERGGEEAFLAGPVDELCGMLDDWRINAEWRDLPEEVWAFLRRHKFFGMIIPRDYGGLGFSAFAHSEVVKRISTRSVAAAVTVMVPNSLGPGELLLRFGTEEQKRVLPAPACRRPRDPLLRAHERGGRVRRLRDGRPRRRVLRRA